MKTNTGMPTRTVYVRQYLRFRFDKWETVTQHYRSPPSF